MWMYLKAKHPPFFFSEMHLWILKTSNWAVSVLTGSSHHESSYESSMCVAHTHKHTDNPFLSLPSTHFHLEIPVCLLQSTVPPPLFTLSITLLVAPCLLSFISLSLHPSCLSLFPHCRWSPVICVCHPLSVAVFLWLEAAVLPSHHLSSHWYF